MLLTFPRSWACTLKVRVQNGEDTSHPGFPLVEVEATPVVLMLSLLVLPVRVEGC